MFEIVPCSELEISLSLISYSLSTSSSSHTTACESFIDSAISIDVLTPSAISFVTLSPPIGITVENLSTHSSYTVTQVVEAHTSIHTTHSSFCLFVSTHSALVRRFGKISYISIPTSATAFFIFPRIFLFIENIFAITSSFLADIPIGFLTHSSRSTIKYSGTTLSISLFGKSTPFRAISRTLSISSGEISSPETAMIHLLVTTSKDDELKEIFTQVTCSPDIFSASSSEESKLDLNSSISRIFHFLIAYEFAAHTPST